MLLLHTSSALGPHHACEVKSRDVGSPMGIVGKFQLPELAMGGKVSSCPGKALQSLGHHIGTAQQPVGLWPVLHGQQIRTSGINWAVPSPWVHKVHTLRPREGASPDYTAIEGSAGPRI